MQVNKGKTAGLLGISQGLISSVFNFSGFALFAFCPKSNLKVRSHEASAAPDEKWIKLPAQTAAAAKERTPEKDHELQKMIYFFFPASASNRWRKIWSIKSRSRNEARREREKKCLDLISMNRKKCKNCSRPDKSNSFWDSNNRKDTPPPAYINSARISSWSQSVFDHRHRYSAFTSFKLKSSSKKYSQWACNAVWSSPY